MPSKREPVLVRTLVDGVVLHEKIETLKVYTDRFNQPYVNKMGRRLPIIQEGSSKVALWHWTHLVSLSTDKLLKKLLGIKSNDHTG